MSIDTDALTEALLNSMGGDKAVTSTGEMARFGTCLTANIVHYLRSQGHAMSRAYGTVSEVATYLGRGQNTVRDWLRKLEAQDRIKPIQGVPLRDGARGDTLYKFKEVEEELRKERVSYNSKNIRK